MAHLGKLKVPATLLAAHAHAAAAAAPAAHLSASFSQARRFHTQQHQQRTHTATAARAGSAAASQRWMSSRSSESGSSASAAGASSPSLLLLAALGGSLVGGALMLSNSEVAAEKSLDAPAASDSLMLLPPLDDSALPPVAPSLGGGLGATSGKKKRKKKRVAREQLSYPGKFAHLHRDASSVVQVATSQGLRLQVPLVGYEPHPSGVQDKQITVIPVIEMGSQNGTQAQLIVHTNLGASHKLEATWDTAGSANGSYKHTSVDGWLRGLSLKPTLSTSPNGTMWSMDVDYKGKTSAFALTSVMGMEWTANYCKAITRTLSTGVEVHYALQQFTHLNGGMRYRSEDRRDQVVLSKKDNKYLATYYRLVSEDPHFITFLTQGQQPYPPVTTEMGVEAHLNGGSLKSDVVVGLRYTRSTFVYHASLSAGGILSLDVQSDPVMGVPLKCGVNAAVPLDSQNDAQIGVSFLFQI